jgi:hypothetical protein
MTGPSACFRAALLVAVLFPVGACAGAFIEHAEPPVAQTGKTTRVTLVGHELNAALDLWTSLPAGKLTVKPVESQPDRAVFDVTVAADAPVGLCGVRVATRYGLSNAHLFWIDDLPVRTAVSGQALTAPGAYWGRFREAEVDRFPLPVSTGQRLNFEVVNNRFGKDADPLLTIRDPAGKLVAQHDNDAGMMFDARFEHEFRAAGTHSVEVCDARFHGSEHFLYVLRVGTFPVFESMPPGSTPGRAPDAKHVAASALSASPATTLVFNMSPLRANPFAPLEALLLTGQAQATMVQVPGELAGSLLHPGDRHTFAFELAKGQSVHVRSEKGRSPVDLELVLVDRVGRELRRATETPDDLSLEFTAPTEGLFGLVVRDQLHDGGPAFTYHLTVRDAPFPPRLVAEVEGLTIPQGSWQPVPIVVTRTGPPVPIKLKLVGAPPGLRLTPTEIGEKEVGVVCRLVADGSVPVGLATVQIAAETIRPDGRTESTLVHTRPLIDRQLVNVDLIPIALREDQKRLPSTLTDRFAVQITPPAPFEVELPEPAVTLARYQRVEFPIVTTRKAGLTGPILFAAKGGQLADKDEGRTRVYAEFEEATAEKSRVIGSIHSRILSNIGKTLIEVSATGTQDGRTVTLLRTFELNLVTAFAITAESNKLTLQPGSSARVRVKATRAKTFDGPVRIHLPTISGLTLPETVTIPKGQDHGDVEVTAPTTVSPGRYSVQHQTTATVSGFEEEVRGQLFEVEVPAPKKK